MKVGVLRRIGSYLLDIIPIFAVLSLLFTFFIGDLLEPENYDNLIVEHSEITADYRAEILPFFEQYESGVISQDAYQAAIADDTDQYYLDTEEHVQAMLIYFRNALVYYIAAFTVLYYAYSVVTKGRTLGRKLMRIELKGSINWWTLLIREVIWKTGYYLLTFVIGGIIIDILMIKFSNKKNAPRDYITKITVKYEGADYPF